MKWQKLKKKGDSDDEDEGEEGYKLGGYHPVKNGEVYNQRLVLIFMTGF